jgi:hypothetical protein
MNTIALFVVAMVAAIIHPAPTMRIQHQTRLIDFQHSPLSSGPLIAAGLRTGQIRFVPRPWRGTLFQDLTCTPAPCVFANVQASGGSAPANETPVVANPKKPTHLLAGANDYSCSSSLAGFYGSTNGGSTFTRTCATLVPGGSSGGGDPVVGYDLKSDAYRGSISFLSTGPWAIGVSKSINNGATWSPAVLAVPSLIGGTSGASDKPWMEVDTSRTSRWPNWIYISATQFNQSNNDTEISVSHSTDGNGTWTSTSVIPVSHFPVINQFSDLAITKDGTVYVSWMQCSATGVSSDCGGTVAHMLVSKSNDGGNTWSAPVKVHKVTLAPDRGCCYYGAVPGTSERLSNIPVIASDNSTGPNAGALYITDYTYTHGYTKVQVTKSIDGGAHWSKAIGVAPASNHHDQFFPWINVSATGAVGVTWMDRRNDPSNLSYEEFGAVSTDGGVTYPNTQIATNPSNPNNDGFGGTFIGDYTGNAWAGKALYATWTDTSNGSSDQDMLGGLLTL